MKAKMLKIAGVKSEAAFYKKFPSQEAFMKVHGKEFKKAKLGLEIQKAQFGFNAPGIPQEGYNVPQQQTMLQGPMNQSNDYYQNNNPFVTTNPGATSINNPAIATATDSGGMGKMLGGMDPMSSATKVIEGFSNLRKERQERKKAEQWNQVTDLTRKASASKDVNALNNRKYVRPEDYTTTGNELFPVNGVGTNVLAKDGAEIQNTYAPNDLYNDLGYEPLNDSSELKVFQEGGMSPDVYGSIGSMATNLGQTAMGGQNAGGQIGGTIGKGAGMALGGPLGGAIGEFVGGMGGQLLDTNTKKIKQNQDAIQRNIAGMAADAFAKDTYSTYSANAKNGTYISNDWTPQVITKFGDHTAKDYYDYAHENDTLRTGGNIRNNENMSQEALGGEVKTTWGGTANTISQNPFMPGDGETIEFKGNSHTTTDNNGHTGIGVKFGNEQNDSYTDYAEYGSKQAQASVEVQGGEPAHLDDKGNLNVLGALLVNKNIAKQTGNPEVIAFANKYHNKKFQNIGKDIASKTNTVNKHIEKATNKLSDLKINSPMDKLALNSFKAIIEGNTSKLKEYAKEMEIATNYQTSINDSARDISEQLGYKISADSLAKNGKIKKDMDPVTKEARWGKNVLKAQVGVKMTGNYNENKEYVNIGQSPGALNYTPIGADTSPDFSTQENYNNYLKKANALYDNPESAKTLVEHFKNYSGKDWQDVRAQINKGRTFEDQVSIARKLATDGLPGPYHTGTEQYSAPIKSEIISNTQKIQNPEILENVKTQPVAYTRNKYIDYANMILPYIKKQPNEQLNPNQLLGEMYSMSHNQEEPVQSQSYQPELDIPYDISFQDQLNENQAAFRSAQKMAGYNPAAQSNLASQMYSANSKVLGEQFRANQAEKANVYDKNRATINDAKLKNLNINDVQYGRQAQAKSNTKAITQAALQSIGDKYVQNALENRKERVNANLYPQYSYDSAGRIINTGPLTQFNIPSVGSKQGTQRQIPVYGKDGKLEKYQLEEYDPNELTKPENATPGIVAKNKNGGKIKSTNGSIVSFYKNS